MLEVENVSRRFGGIQALEGCSLRLEKGKITALIGPNGSGKSTLFNLISRLVKEEKGRILFHQQEITARKDFQVARLGISRTFQEVRLFNNLTIKDHLEIALRKDDEQLFRGIWGRKKDYTEKVKEVLQKVNLKKPLDTLATDLSYGERKLLDLAMAMAKPHLLLMLDEPVAGVNPQRRQEIKEILKSLRKQGEAVFLIEHDMNFVMDLADYVLVLENGQIIAEGFPEEIQNNVKVLEAYLGK